MSGLHLKAISHAFGKHRVLNGVSVFVQPGELVCLLGPSGCGKTTLLRIAAGLEELQTGQVEINGAVVADGAKAGHLPPERRDVGLMFQDYALFPHLSVADNIAFGMGETPSAQRTEWVKGELAQTGLAGYAKAYPHTLSGGQQQRVALLRALAPGPKVLLLDEPFSGLDVTRRAQVRADTLAMVKRTGVATLMVTHDPEEAMFMADRILVMNEGRVVQDGSPTDLYFHPADAFVAELFGPVNRFRASVRNGMAETPIGAVEAKKFTDGAEVQVLIRPEGLRLSETAGAETATAESDGNLALKTAPAAMLEVVTARPLGRSSYVLLKLADGATLEARVPGVFLPDTGSRVSVTVVAGQTHVFAA